jgi:hypothetical protein
VVYDLHSPNAAGAQSAGETARKAMKVRTCLIGALILMAMPLGAGERLAMSVSPAVSFAPARLVVRAVIAADGENRAVKVVAESGEFYRASEVELDGDRAPRTSMFEFRSLPPGDYQVTATLLGADGQSLAYKRTQVNVVSSGTAR